MNTQLTKIFFELQQTLKDKDSTDFIESSLEFLVQKLGGIWGTYWYLDTEAKVLKFEKCWHPPLFNVATFDIDIEKQIFVQGQGIPGTVWRTQKPVWSRDISKDMMLPRSLRAMNAGFEVGMWIPVSHKNKFMGVVEILGRNDQIRSDILIDFLQSVGDEIGKKYSDSTKT